MLKFKFPQDSVCFIPVILFIILVFPYFGQAPSLDPMVNYRHSAFFFQGGFPAIIGECSTAHPPLLYLISSISFRLFGTNPLSINIAGTLLLTFTSSILFFTVKKIFDRRIALTLILLLLLNPLVMVNYFYVTSEVLILSGTIFALSCYFFKKYFLLSVSLALLALMKETAVSIIVALFLAWSILIIFQKSPTKTKISEFLNLGLIFSPAVLTLFFWHQYITSLGTTEWRDTTFIMNGTGSYEMVLRNLLTWQILNRFLKENLTNVLWLNFQWVYSLTILLTIPWIWRKAIGLFRSKMQIAFLITAICLTLVYALLVLSFPTWTIPRYSIPALLMLFLVLAILISELPPKVHSTLLIGLITLSIIASRYSIDPLTPFNKLLPIYGVNLYDLPFWDGGADRLMYNLQFLQAVKNQNTIIKKAISLNADIISTSCNELKLGEKLWSIYLHRDFYPEFNLQKKMECINIDEETKLDKFPGKIIYNPATDYSFSPLGNI